MNIKILSNRTYLLPSIKAFLTGKNVLLFLPDNNKILISELQTVCNLEVVPPLAIDTIASGSYKIPDSHYDSLWCTTTTNANTMGAMVVVQLLKSCDADSITDAVFINRYGIEIQDNLDLITEYHSRPRFGKTPWRKWDYDYETQLLEKIGAIEFYAIDYRVDVAAKMEKLEEFLLAGTLNPALKFYVEDNKKRIEKRLEPVDDLIITDSVCYVKASTRAAFGLAYQHKPVVIVDNPCYQKENGIEPFRKTTIAQWESGYLDMSHLIGELNSIELGHGGDSVICGSSKTSPTNIPPEKLIEVVEKYLIK